MTTPARAADIVFTRHPARRGLAWLRESWAMFSRERARWVVLVVLYYVAMGLVARLPWVGQVAGFAVKPLFAVGLLAAAWAQERGGRPTPSDLLRGFHSNLAALLSLGLVMLGGTVLAMTTASLISGNLLLQLFDDPQAPIEEIMRNPRLQFGLLVGALVALPVSLALWFAPALVVFQDAGARTALGASLRATLANWRPIAVFWIVAFAVGAMLPVLLIKVVAGLLPTEVAEVAEPMFLVGWGMILMATLHIADYVTYRDVFHSSETLAPAGPGASR